MRVRNHVNPFHIREAPEKPDWCKIFDTDNPFPLELDLGSARGEFTLERAKVIAPKKIVGLEIRTPCVKEAKIQQKMHFVENVHFIDCNIRLSLPILFDKQTINSVYIFFPDPWFKKRHIKRRMVTPPLVKELSEILIPGGMIFLQSDYLPVIEHMVELISDDNTFQLSLPLSESHPPFELNAQTDREKHLIKQGKAIFRAQFKKAAQADECLP